MIGALALLAATTVAPNWVLTLDQSFDGAAGLAPDTGVWARDLGNLGFNGELETYTDGAANAFLDGQGHLVIEARKEGSTYTSARLKTQGKFAQRYGKIEARMKLPQGQGMWPAFWMLGADIDTVSWPNCGEIDTMENIGRNPNTVYGTMHGPDYSGADGIGNHLDDSTLSTAFHNYTVEWSPTKVVWSLDGTAYHTVNASDVGTKEWPFEKPFFLLLNLAVGGDWPGAPDGTTVFPQRLVVDYVRVWKDANLKVDEAALARYHQTRMYGPESYVASGPVTLPGIVKLSDYLPGEGKGFHDVDFYNEGKAYRWDGVDIQTSGLSDAPYNIGWTKAGEWLTYSVNVPRGAWFLASAYVASDGKGGTMELDVDGGRVGRIPVANTGGWSVWREMPFGTVPLRAGKHTVKLRMISNGVTTGSTGNAAYVRFAKL